MKFIVRGFVNLFRKLSNWAEDEPEVVERSVYEAGEEMGAGEEIHSLWDYLKFIDNTQAAHITGVLGFDEWVTMDEIKRRIMAVFNIRYTNDRSLYPYVKTLVDCGLLETTSAGGRRSWRKKDLIIKTERGEEKEGAWEKKKAKVKKSISVS